MRAVGPFDQLAEELEHFDAQGPGPAKPDIFVSFRNPDGSWCKGIKLPASINTEDGELCPSVSPDERYLFFSRLTNNDSNIYWVDFDVARKLKQP